MVPRNLLIQVSLAALVLMAANVAIHRFSQNSIPRQLLRVARNAVGVTDLFLGNSMVQAALDESVMAKAFPGSRPLNLALGATSPVEHYLFYRQQTNQTIETVYYGYSGTLLTDQVLGIWTNLVGNGALAYYVEPDVAWHFYASGSPVQKLFFKMCSFVPMVVERGGIWGRVERLRRWLGAIGLPPQETNRFGRAEDFKQLILSESDLAARCEKVVSDKDSFAAPIEALFNDVRASHRRLCVIDLPIPSKNREMYQRIPAWKAYQNHLKDLVRRVGGDYVDASDWVDDSGFADPVHLSHQGSVVFSERIGRWAASR